MFYASKGNKVCQIHEPEVQRYLDSGFDILDESGAVIHKAVPTDVTSLKLAYVEHIARIKELEDEIAKLRSEGSRKAKAVADVESADEVVAKRPTARKSKTE